MVKVIKKKVDINKYLYLILFLISILSLTVSSQLTTQINPTSNIITVKNQITPSISLEENKICTTTFYDETRDVFGNCIYYHNYTSCLNNSGSNTGCSLRQDLVNFSCKISKMTVTNNKTDCKPDNKFLITVKKGIGTSKKLIDFSEWGACIYNAENNCLIVTCVANDDGAFKEQFTDCKGGKTCQKFEICENGIKTFYKNSREKFVEYDPTFYLSKLVLKEVQE